MTSKRATFAPRAFGGNPAAAPVISPPPAVAKPAQSGPSQVHFKPASPAPIAVSSKTQPSAKKPIIIPISPPVAPAKPSVVAPAKPAVVVPAAVSKPAVVVAKPAPVVITAKPVAKPVVQAMVKPAPAPSPQPKSSAPSAPAPAPAPKSTAPAIKADVKKALSPKAPAAAASAPSTPQSLFARLAKFKSTTSTAAPAPSKRASPVPSPAPAPAAAAQPKPAASPSTPAALFAKLAKFQPAGKPAATKSTKPAAPIKKDSSSVSLVTLALVLGFIAIAFNMVGGGMQSGVLRNPASDRCFAHGLSGPVLSSNCGGSGAKLSFESYGGNSVIHPYSDPTKCATDHHGAVKFKKCTAGAANQQWDLSGGHAKSVISKQQGNAKCMSQSQFWPRSAALTNCVGNNPAQVFHFQASRVG